MWAQCKSIGVLFGAGSAWNRKHRGGYNAEVMALGGSQIGIADR
jgi:hypothetical protein